MKFFTLLFLLISFSAKSAELEVKITSLENLSGGGALEVCGKVTNQTNKTSLVTIKHDISYYTTLTDEKGQWCLVYKRWTNNGEVTASARNL
jgi:aspartate/tyrosine/aromatic aminotransferase